MKEVMQIACGCVLFVLPHVYRRLVPEVPLLTQAGDSVAPGNFDRGCRLRTIAGRATDRT
jgi:hypothetical protein